MMKRSLLYYCFLLLAVVCASCYESDDLESAYEEHYQMPDLVVSLANRSLTTAEVEVELFCPKYESQIDFYYSDQYDADLITQGEKQSFIVADANQMLETKRTFTLKDLMPETWYHYMAVYTDVSGKTVQTKRESFRTLGFDMFAQFHEKTYFEMWVSTSFEKLPSGARPGYIYGTQPNLTQENALGNVELNRDGSTAGCIEEISVEPDMEYFLRPYVSYKDRVYFGTISSKRTPKIEVDFFHFEASVQRDKSVLLYTITKLLNFSDYYGYTLPQLEYGFLVSDSPGITYEDAEKYVVNPGWLGAISYELYGLIPSQQYFACAYVRWRDKIFLSNEISFTIAK